MIFVHFKFCK